MPKYQFGSVEEAEDYYHECKACCVCERKGPLFKNRAGVCPHFVCGECLDKKDREKITLTCVFDDEEVS